ncbi:MAG: AsmA family protein [Deltaproteobacteria bacterium]|nr:AsmA family protein [Deltaproteobacteria bacterium]
MKARKCLMIAFGLILLAAAILLIAPRLVNLERHRALIEHRITALTGYPVTIGGLKLALLPRLGVKITDLRIGSPQHFNDDLFTMRSLEMRIRLRPLLRGEIQVQRFIANAPRITLIRDSQGQGNWQRPAAANPDAQGKQLPSGSGETAPTSPIWEMLQNLSLRKIAIRNGTCSWQDEKNGIHHQISAVQLEARSVEMKRPVQLTMTGDFNGVPLEVTGQVGPLDDLSEGEPANLNINARLAQENLLHLEGEVALGKQPAGNITVYVEHLSPRGLLAALGRDLPRLPDPEALSHVSLEARVTGTPHALQIEGGILRLDDSTLEFSLETNWETSKMKARLDRLDADRYFPTDIFRTRRAGTPAPLSENGKKASPGPPAIQGDLKIGQLKIGKMRLREIDARVECAQKRCHAPLALKLYDGTAKGSLEWGARQQQLQASAQLNSVQIGQLMQDVTGAPGLQGALNARFNLNANPARFPATLRGSGAFEMKRGSLLLPQSLETLSALWKIPAFGKGKLDFSRMHGSFTIADGRITLGETLFELPPRQILAAGKADLVRETLDLGLSLRNREAGDETVTVPVRITGKFSRPVCQPDSSFLRRLREDGYQNPDLEETLKQDKKTFKILKKHGEELFKELF